MSNKTVRYVGVTQEDALRQYREDSARIGMRVKAKGWGQNLSQPTLVVKYSDDEPPTPPPPPPSQPPVVEESPSPPLTPEPPLAMEAPVEAAMPTKGYRKPVLAVGLLALVAIALASALSGSGDGPTPGATPGPAPAMLAPDKFEQTWAKGYDITTCHDFVKSMNAHERWALSADFLYTAFALAGPDAAELPTDSQVDEYRDLLDVTCGDVDARPSVLLTDIAAYLVLNAGDLRP